MKIKEIDDLYKLYNFFKKIYAPYLFTTTFEEWKESLLNDIDGEGRKLFTDTTIKGAYMNEGLVGFIQYGISKFGFDENGEISDKIHYQIIRNIYFDRNFSNAGKLLLNSALEEFNSKERIYAFFHYFGMSVYARHGKLFEKYDYIEELLKDNGFVIEHENVYYSLENISDAKKSVEVQWNEYREGNTQCAIFKIDDKWVGECEVHFVSNHNAYLRWIYIDENMQNKGIGSRCIQSLMHHLAEMGYVRLDTDTALVNEIEQNYYEKNGFKREGITRSYYLDYKI